MPSTSQEKNHSCLEFCIQPNYQQLVDHLEIQVLKSLHPVTLSQKVSRRILHQKKKVDPGNRRQFPGWKKEEQGSPNMTPVQEPKKSVS